ncbi:hypothetical protein TVAG_196200 [Trichomonas vaginalis G3]|uniref:Thioredoxin domain-containing protein n=1 Tax=Trichomonas vaginalis (strain ATCC PRA-98 / G3) TaxID=412133 RepID=A2F4V2_TRIV3|nr:DNAJ-like protein subfamily C member 16 family [Trichomonas vaginalis G3]EAY00060.1 hypothetical protein TVAG_196200 [Trichomonas vaginalis G3]KAI5543746.1 DNAJ-like protein subfamily C member 16 family [Trichomonas vaginalis G3]|eukprot:XP_001312989.1 hypothetical protein [Trichomonas vaginalis G3]
MDNAPKKDHSVDVARQIINREMTSRSTNKNYGEFDRREQVDVVIEMTDQNFQFKTSDGRPWVILVYQHYYDYQSNKPFLEDLFQKTGLLFGIARMQISQSPKIVEKFGIRYSPQLVVYDSKTNNHFLFNGEMKLGKVINFATRKFGADVTVVHSDEEMLKWRKQNLDKLHIILFSDLKDVPNSFLLAAAFLKYNCVFAFASINKDTIPKFPRALGSTSMEDLPTFVFYRMANPQDDTFGGPVIPIVAPMDLDSGCLAALARHFSFPVFSEVNSGNYNRLCSGRCILFCEGREIAEDIKIGANAMNIETGTINLTLEPEFKEKFDLEPGDFVFIKPKENKYARWREITTWKEFRTNIEFANKGLLTLNSTDSIPKIQRPPPKIETPKTKKIEEIERAVKNSLLDVLVKFNSIIKSLPPIAVLGGLALVLVLFGEMISRCLSPKVETPKHDKKWD